MKLISKIAISAGVAGIAALAVVAPASAATGDLKTVQAIDTIAPGMTGKVGATLWNDQKTALTGTTTLTMKAPSHSTFVSSQVLFEDVPNGQPSGNTRVGGTCTLSDGNTVMTCSNLAVSVVPDETAESGLRMFGTVSADSTSPSDQVISDGLASVTANGAIPAGQAALQFRTPVISDTPIVAPAIAAGAGIVAVGAAGIKLVRRRRSA